MSYVADPERGQVVEFDGIDDWISVANDPSLNPKNREVSFSYRVNYQDNPNNTTYQYVLHK